MNSILTTIAEVYGIFGGAPKKPVLYKNDIEKYKVFKMYIKCTQ